MNEIAVLQNGDETCSWQRQGVISLYKQNDDGWIKSKSIPYILSLEDCDINYIKDYYIQLLSQFNVCTTFVAKRLSGFLVNFLEYYGFKIYELDGNPLDFLDFILISEKRDKEIKIFLESQVIDMFAPHKIDEYGNYKLDLNKLLQSNQKVTSKQVIIPFLKKQNIQSLEIICDHVPKWFDNLLKEMGFHFQVTPSANCLISVHISPI